jgi:hypothetical protein
MSSSPPLRIEFMKLEYEAMMTKMSELRADLSRTETIYSLAPAAIYAWVLTHNPGGSRLWAGTLLLPPVVIGLGLLRIRARQKTMALLEHYCRSSKPNFTTTPSHGVGSTSMLRSAR